MNTDFSVGIVIPAGGSGVRFGSTVPKQYLPIGGTPCIVRTITSALTVDGCASVVIAVAGDSAESVLELLEQHDVADTRIHLVAGGPDRQTSVANALRHDSLNTVDVLAIHDAVRPLASIGLWNHVIQHALDKGAAIPVLPVVDTIKRVIGDCVDVTVDRSTLRRVQTPQAFRYAVIRMAYDAAEHEGWTGTDCSSLCERVGVDVHCVVGEEQNIKITTPFDILVAEAFLLRNY